MSAALLCFSCDPEKCSEFLIKNSSNLDVDFIFVEGEINKEVNLKKQSILTFVDFNCDSGGAPLLYLENYDSIYVSKDKRILKVWKPTTEGKNIYDIDRYWRVEEIKKNDYTYTFEIIDKDLE